MNHQDERSIPRIRKKNSNTNISLKPHESINQRINQFNSIKPTKTNSNLTKKSLSFSLILILIITILTLFYYKNQWNSKRSNDLSIQQNSKKTSYKYQLPIGSWEDEPRREVIEAIKESWSAYANSQAWGSDDFYVLTGTGGNLTKSGSIGYFIVDVLDTLILTKEMNAEYDRIREYIKNDLRFDIDGDFNAFETTIRVLGGLLSAYHLTGKDELYLDKAIDLGTRLLPIFDTPTGIPYSFINLKTGKAKADQDNNGFSSLAEATTLQLEFKYLAELTQDRKFWDVAEKAMMAIKSIKSYNGLLPILISPIDGSTFFHIRIGSRGDSYYEYLIKQYLQTNRTENVYREMYDVAMTGIKEELVRDTPGGLVYTGELHPAGAGTYTYVPKQDHLVCFLGGSLMLGVTEGQSIEKRKEMNEDQTEDWEIGKELIKTCVDTYEKTKTGLAPEIVEFSQKSKVNEHEREWIIPHYDQSSPPLDARNILRPETVESLFLAWRSTHDPIYREWGWQIFKAFEEFCHSKSEFGGYHSILDVDSIPIKVENKMETFWLAETLKYLLLLFSEDSVLPLDQYVFNTEAHLFPVFQPTVVDVNSLGNF
ncbi:family 47 glycoside hydrolase [Melampsora americana]|nr:family 47 glycoside hydrolase [Melampsora americana]